MAGMERFTQRAKRVLSFAHQEVEHTRKNSINTEHLLVGLMLEESGVAGRVLHELGLTVERVRDVIERIATPSEDFDPARVELGSETQQSLEFAVEETRRLGHHYIGTEHILLGLVRVEGTAMEVLRRLGVTTNQIRRQTRRVLNETAGVPQNISLGMSLRPERIHEVLILHGPEDQRKTIAAFIQSLWLTPILIDNHSAIEFGLDLLDGFSNDAELAILVLSNDPQAEETKSKMSERPDQNIAYELGYFRGKLGRKRVCVLYRDNFYEEVKSFSPFTGVVFIPFDTAGTWMTLLTKTIQDIGLRPSP
jgi:predicted nucleotide-binding protein